MSKGKYTKNEIAQFEETVIELACGMETMGEEEFDEKYDSLPIDYQLEVDDNCREFADNAVGSDIWRSDE